jgi:hypothetical protein
VQRSGREVQAAIARTDYKVWCAANGCAPVNQVWFGKVMKDELGIQKKRGSGNRFFYVGIGLMKVVNKESTKRSDPREERDASANMPRLRS